MLRYTCYWDINGISLPVRMYRLGYVFIAVLTDIFLREEGVVSGIRHKEQTLSVRCHASPVGGDSGLALTINVGVTPCHTCLLYAYRFTIDIGSLGASLNALSCWDFERVNHPYIAGQAIFGFSDMWDIVKERSSEAAEALHHTNANPQSGWVHCLFIIHRVSAELLKLCS